MGKFGAGSTPGTYTAEITSTGVVEAEITVELKGTALDPLVTDEVAANVTAIFTSGGPDADNEKTNFEVTSSTPQLVVEGTHTVLIRVVDADDNPVKNMTLGSFGFSADPETGVEFENFQNRNNGEYTIDVKSSSSGEKTIIVKIGAIVVAPVNVAKSIADFKAGDLSIENPFLTNYTVSDFEAVAGVDFQTVTVNVADSLGNPIRTAAATLNMTVTGLPDNEKTGFAEIAPGKYTATITSSVAGTLPVTVTLEGKTIPLLPTGGLANAVFIAGAPAANNSVMEIADETVQVAEGKFTTVTV